MMAARSDAADTPGPKNSVFMSVSLVSSSSIDKLGARPGLFGARLVNFCLD